MFGIGIDELLVGFFLLLIWAGIKKLPETGRSLRETMRENRYNPDHFDDNPDLF